ncbi:Aldo/keto reductase [Punctularia strigosozonata HHB-11173 SS5]|uniref:Aldo/keto reductase n=1 Tax=Punctularia strigosozonata (strain HHB-11173) TaxID=741275 RepID=UPI000441848C|nr:Aldo/keto reductase [Punctularia strigosozonata HHB-11173 SS5]EIN05498.1 Aldo/keto reductase [Punctularia strigosozonata HHB-11173 SS5]
MSSTKPFPTRKLAGEDVSAIGYGAMGIGNIAYGTSQSEDERLKVRFRPTFLDALYESGCTFWDTANIYGDSEDLIGKWFAKTGLRSKIFLATKFGIGFEFENGVCGKPEYARQSCETSLKRLGIDTIDLYYLHRPDPTVPIEETVLALKELVKEGKVRHIGLSEPSAATLRRAHAIHPIAAVQVEYSPFTLDIEDPKINLLATARELGVKIIAYSPIGRGLLTGRYKSPDDFEEGDFRKIVARYSAENFPNILRLVDGLAEIGKRHGATAGQVALAWLLAQGEDVIPIPGTTQLKYLKENLGAVDVKLTPEEVKEVKEIAHKADATQGDRYPPFMMKALFADTPEWKGAA